MNLTLAAAELGLCLPSDAEAAFCELAELLRRANTSLNLVGSTDPAELREQFVDCLLHAVAIGPVASLVDLGSGAGLPGLGVALVRPETEIVLVESHQRRAGFAAEAARVLRLANVTVLPRRAEEVGRDPVWREYFAAATARRVAPLNLLLEYALPLLRVGGRGIFAKGAQVEQELAAAAGAPALLGGGEPHLTTVGRRRFVVVDKLTPTPERYPRRVGIPAKRPLGGG